MNNYQWAKNWDQKWLLAIINDLGDALADKLMDDPSYSDVAREWIKNTDPKTYKPTPADLTHPNDIIRAVAQTLFWEQL